MCETRKMASPPELANVRRSWLERLLDVVRELGQTSDLRLMLQRIAEAAVDFLDFGAAAINVVEDERRTWSGWPRWPARRRCSQLLGQTSALPYWLDLLDAAEAWGSLRFFSHEQDQSLFDQIASWTPDSDPVTDPDAWDPQDALFAPLIGPDGALLGVLSVDQPASGRRPRRSSARCWNCSPTRPRWRSPTSGPASGPRAPPRCRAPLAGRLRTQPDRCRDRQPGRQLAQANASLASMLGYPREQLLGMPFTELTHPEDVDADLALFAELVAGRRDSYEMSKRYLAPRRPGAVRAAARRRDPGPDRRRPEHRRPGQRRHPAQDGRGSAGPPGDCTTR